MRILVTGAAGFVGANLLNHLSTTPAEIVALDDFSSASWKNLVGFGGDVLTLNIAGDIDPLWAAQRFDAIFHQASITDTTVMDQRQMMHNNVEGFRHVLDLAVEWNARVIWASSASIYGRNRAPNSESQPPQPLNVYAYSKLAMERLAAKYVPRLRQPIIGLRYFNVYGPLEDHKGKFASMIHQLARQMRAGKRPRVFTAGQQRRDFVYVDDVVQANLLALKCEQSGVYNVGSGQGESFNEVIAQLNRVLKTDLPPEYFENPYNFTQDCTQADLTAANKKLGYQPAFHLPRGIEAYHSTGKLGVS